MFITEQPCVDTVNIVSGDEGASGMNQRVVSRSAHILTALSGRPIPICFARRNPVAQTDSDQTDKAEAESYAG